MWNRVLNKFSSIANCLYFSICAVRYNIRLGHKFCIHGILNFRMYKTSILSIGDDFYFSNARRLVSSQKLAHN